MATIDPCKLLCASESAYCISTSANNGRYNPCDMNFDVTDNMRKQYNSVNFIGDPFVIVASPIPKYDKYIKIEACLVGETAEGIIISFRGTLPPVPVTVDSIADWIENIFYVDTKPYIIGKPGEVHEGFLDAFMLLKDGIINALNVLNPNYTKPIYITGHSKGGAVAPIAAMYFKEMNIFQATEVLTFAGPKPGNGEFRDVFNLAFPHYTNYENYLDIVPFLPPGKVFIDLIANIPFLPDVIKKLLHEAANLDYEPVGSNNVQFVNKHGIVDNSFPESNPLLRFGKILEELTKGKPGAEQIANAHHITCGFRYIKGVCKGTICPK
ncbi:MAG: lipase family protein [Psychroserpens sp.]|uniref:lipase family protein n=1 Tax=Psychroserpens sp. TaxID=2020870 RepID=UPI003002DAB1